VVEDDRARAAIAARAATGYARSELKMRRGDGTEFVADVSSNVFTNEAGEVRACVTFRDITDQVSLRAELQEKTALLDRLVREDELTKLHNRRGFGEQAAQAFAIADRDDVPIQLVFLDVDGLKCINDGLGHDAGDEALERLAAAIRAETRASDVAARLGGDEFVVLLYGATPDLVESTMGRILRACREMADGRPAVRFSYGVVTRASGAPTSLDHLLHEADQRMYLRKANRGRAN
jgi:diguanylate cyclase (GGDEF)-like protein